MLHHDLYELYGLSSGNPYANRSLDSLTVPSDRPMMRELQGFIQLDLINDEVNKALKSGGPAFFLIVGVADSGRTSLANHMMYLYRKAAGGEGPESIFLTHCADGHDLTHDAYGSIRSTLLSLRNQMNRRQIGISTDLSAWFDKLSSGSAPLNEYDLQCVAESVAEECAIRDVRFGIRYEDVPDRQLIFLARKVFEGTRTVVVFTVGDYRHANAAQLTEADRHAFAARGHIVDLTALSAEQMELLASERWTGRDPCPFERDGVRQAFKTCSYPIGKAMRYLEILLALRLNEYERDERWPVDALRIGEAWIQRRLTERDWWKRV